MRKTLGTLALLLFIVVGVGLYRGWFNFYAEDQPGETNVELRIDKDKIKQDAEAAQDKARKLTSQDTDATVDESSDDAQ